MFKKILLVLIVLIMAGAGAGYYYYTEQLKPVSNDQAIELFEVSKNEGLNRVVDNLQTQGFIKNAMLTKFVAKQENFTNTYAGKFQISKSMTPQEILSIITDKSKIYIEYFDVKILPGKWAKDYAAEIESKTGISESAILEKWNDLEYLNKLINEYQVLTEDILNDNTVVKLEGYFAPETYKINKEHSSIEEITKRILDPTEKFYLDNKELFDKSSLSVHELFTLASMLQFEATNRQARPEFIAANEQQLVASVFFNRLSIGMKLQSSVPVCYALYDFSDWQECEKNIAIDSLYNTYRYAGLPVGPVSNPTQSALSAVLNPIKSDYLFFVADVYNNTGTYFSKTFAEHDKYVKELLGR
ncbi:MAG: endolytic transglycosylase MltG [Erysipelothrix sp.]|nr:endolytic transglycosylase MltG [Erysipelothrix sp.]